jgi:succinoglycan biosynthesis protein ExoL
VLKALAQRGNGAFEIQLRGVVFGLDGLEQEAHRVPHLALGGPYRVPDDLAAMYGSVDLVWACYPYNGRPDGNWRMVRTNRFYEACLFGVPMIAQAGSVDARVVEQYGIGRGLDLSAVDRAVDALLALDPEVIEGWSSRFASLPESVYRETDEHERLLEALRA